MEIKLVTAVPKVFDRLRKCFYTKLEIKNSLRTYNFLHNASEIFWNLHIKNNVYII